MASADALRFRVSVSPGSPLHDALMALPVDARANAVLRWATAALDAGSHGPGSQGTLSSPSSPSSSASVDAPASALTSAVLRLSAAVERLAAGRDAGAPGRGSGGGGDPANKGSMADARAAGLDAAWGEWRQSENCFTAAP